MNAIRVALVEDHHLTRVGLRAALEQYEDIQVVGEAADGKKGLEVLKATSPDVAVVDIGLPIMDGIELTQQLRQYQVQAPEIETETKILVLTMNNKENEVLAAFAAGADSYSVKDIYFENLVEAIRVTNGGDSWIDPAIAKVVLKQAQQKLPRTYAPSGNKTTIIASVEADRERILETYPLTKRELDVLELIVAGHSNDEISKKLYITVGTVKTHVRNLLNKLCADDRTQAAVLALRSGLVF